MSNCGLRSPLYVQIFGQRLFSQLSQAQQAWENDGGVTDPYPWGLACRRHPGVEQERIWRHFADNNATLKLADWGGGRLSGSWKKSWGKKSALLEKRKQPHPCTLWTRNHLLALKTTVWPFIIVLLTALTYAHMKKCFMCASKDFFMWSYSLCWSFTLKYLILSMLREMSYRIFCA